MKTDVNQDTVLELFRKNRGLQILGNFLKNVSEGLHFLVELKVATVTATKLSPREFFLYIFFLVTLRLEGEIR